ncbi:iron chelate uptake ABC transporter family permease subunit [Vibrio parahaemolyticus]|uniref:Iron chelate uptake ABC transporter family permease subunit n=2 Tax=Vibrio parahaemolyticus TaxID=670 RepID=A0A9Q3UBB8_VIBPH|nr:iron chelate uptake ABC transporter family permease subunit [Vibrio parahaemolyticus]EGQ8098412.1 iron chelate uptake ABC transporter family permease subunit [Vibrio parahaemolyticus]EGQ8547189.1 iron chelate uptake ABC transporter family permease subunit [Vibrio parahaemolyticus]EGQ9071428.1 iron chelate uptake ABC transporter family permease subunit [Vibrio parahaemolyticus]EGQ9132937.1 iron chelate uptake ABC transporter family permease subunit [Vibrio parahaemolyticus]EGQ9289437.1 iron 
MSASIISESPTSVSKSHWKASLFVCAMALCTLSGYTASMIGWSNFSLSVNDLTSYWFAFDEGNMRHQILATLRAPRTYAGLLIGASLAVSGVLMQGLTRNPLASPSILGINAGAACFMALASIGVPFFSQLNPIINAVFGALLSGGAVMLLGGFFSARSHPLRLVLAGIAISALLIGLTRASVILADDMAYSVLHWLTGSLSAVDSQQWLQLWPLATLGLVLAMGLARNLNLLALGDEVAVGLGGNIRLTRLISGLAVVLLAGTSVAIAGPIGFVGLLVPHLVRPIVGHNYHILIPVSALCGAALVTWSDALSRAIAFPAETPVGVITALLGTPCFIAIAMRKSS